MIRTLAKDGFDMEYMIMGAQSKNSNVDVASLVFLNYDDDTHCNYRLCEIAVRDHYGNTTSNGFGNLYMRTNGTGTLSNNLSNRMCVLHNGNIGVGTDTPSCLFDVAGEIKCHKMNVPTKTYVNMRCNVVNASNFLSISTWGCEASLLSNCSFVSHGDGYTIRVMDLTRDVMLGSNTYSNQDIAYSTLPLQTSNMDGIIDFQISGVCHLIDGVSYLKV